jgi:hypothetical protein
VLPVGSFIGDAASVAGFLAATIAVFGFLGQAGPALRRQGDLEVRAATVVGGLVGFLSAISLLAMSRFW